MGRLLEVGGQSPFYLKIRSTSLAFPPHFLFPSRLLSAPVIQKACTRREKKTDRPTHRTQIPKPSSACWSKPDSDLPPRSTSSWRRSPTRPASSPPLWSRGSWGTARTLAGWQRRSVWREPRKLSHQDSGRRVASRRLSGLFYLRSYAVRLSFEATGFSRSCPSPVSGAAARPVPNGGAGLVDGRVDEPLGVLDGGRSCSVANDKGVSRGRASTSRGEESGRTKKGERYL